MIQVALFAAGSVALIWLSRRSLWPPRGHGLYRFAAWECLLVLFLLVAPAWFRDPLSPPQMVSWLLLVTSAALAIYATLLLRRLGRPGAARADPSLLASEKTTVLVRQGVFRYIRHPMYLSLILLGWGMFLNDASWAGLLLAAAATLLLTVTAFAEEDENRRYFGAAYDDYCRRTRMFIPYLF